MWLDRSSIPTTFMMAERKTLKGSDILDYRYTKSIGEWASTNGYRAIKYPSVAAPGHFNIVTLFNF